MLSLAYSKTKTAIHNAVQQYIHGRCDRQEMMDTISEAMAREGVYKIRVKNYYVRQLPSITTSIGEFNVVHFDAPYGVFSRCPTCRNEDEWGCISGEAPIIEVACHVCGTFYKRRDMCETANTGG